MTIDKEVLRNALRDDRLKNIIFKKFGLTGKNHDVEDLIRLSDLETALIHAFLDDYLEFTYEYPHPINPLAQVMNPIKIVGVKGSYLVVEDYEEIKSRFNFFSNQKQALKYAGEAYKSFLDKTKLVDRAKGLKPYKN